MAQLLKLPLIVGLLAFSQLTQVENATAVPVVYQIHSLSGIIDVTADFRQANIRDGWGTLTVDGDSHTAALNITGGNGTFTNLSNQAIALSNLVINLAFGPTARPGHEQINNQVAQQGDVITTVPRGFADQINEGRQTGHWTDQYRPNVDFTFFNSFLAVNPELLIGYLSAGITRTPGHLDGHNTFLQFSIEPIRRSLPTPEIPEPATALLFGLGILGARIKQKLESAAG